MKGIIAAKGWPGKKLVGGDGANAAWTLVQHADAHPAFQQECLALLEKAVAAGDADPADHAYLYDRVAVNQKRPQRYGTQLGDDGEPQPIEDPANVDAVVAFRDASGVPVSDLTDWLGMPAHAIVLSSDPRDLRARARNGRGRKLVDHHRPHRRRSHLAGRRPLQDVLSVPEGNDRHYGPIHLERDGRRCVTADVRDDDVPDEPALHGDGLSPLPTCM
jgi:hypothetical protein